MTAGRGKNKVKEFFAKSKLFSFFAKAASYLFSKAESSITGKIFSSYDENLLEKGLLYKSARKMQLDKRFFRPLKRTTSKLISQSVILSKLNLYLSSFLSIGLNVYGLFFITSGIGFLIVGLLKYYSFNVQSLSYREFLLSVVLILASIPLLFSSLSLASAVCRSKRASAIVFDWLGCKSETFERVTTVTSYSKLAIPIGLLVAVLSVWISPIRLILALVALVFLLAVFYVPETGIVGILFCMPFVSSGALNNLLLYTAICFVLKYIRGKRTIRFDTLGIVVLLFSIVCLFNYPNLYSETGVRFAADSVFSGLVLFFLITNLMKSKKWIKRCIKSLYASYFLVMIFGVARYIAEALNSEYLLTLFGISEYRGMVSCFGSSMVFAQYLVILLPFMFLGIHENKKTYKSFAFVMYVVGIVCLFLADEHIAWLGVVMGLIFFFVLYSKKTLAVMMFVLCILPFVYFNLPKVVFERVSLLNRLSKYITTTFGEIIEGLESNTVSLFGGTGVGSFNYLYGTTDASYGIVYRMACEIGVIGLLLFFVCMFFGIQKNTTLYSRGCSKDGRVITLVSVVAAMSLLGVGFDNNIYGSRIIVLLFWTCIGLSSCVSGTERHNAGMDEILVCEDYIE